VVQPPFLEGDAARALVTVAAAGSNASTDAASGAKPQGQAPLTASDLEHATSAEVSRAEHRYECAPSWSTDRVTTEY
jgi:hypothetical protein